MKFVAAILSLMPLMPGSVVGNLCVTTTTDVLPPCDTACASTPAAAPGVVPAIQAGRCVMLGSFTDNGCTWEVSSVVDIVCVDTGVGFVVRPQAPGAKGVPKVIDTNEGACKHEYGYVGGIQLASGPFGRWDGTQIFPITQALSGITNYVGRTTSGDTFSMTLHDPELATFSSFLTTMVPNPTNNGFARRQIALDAFLATKTGWSIEGNKCTYRSANLVSGCYKITNSAGSSHQAAICYDAVATVADESNVETIEGNSAYAYIDRLHANCPVPVGIECGALLDEIEYALSADTYLFGRSSSGWGAEKCEMLFSEPIYDKNQNVISVVDEGNGYHVLEMPLRLA